MNAQKAAATRACGPGSLRLVKNVDACVAFAANYPCPGSLKRRLCIRRWANRPSSVFVSIKIAELPAGKFVGFVDVPASDMTRNSGYQKPFEAET